MASPDQRLPANAPGDLYVDRSCIDCGACRWIAPQTFDLHGDQSRVHTQPSAPEARRAALQALVSCPTASIGSADARAAADVIADFPRPYAPDILHCGFHAKDSYGAASWLIQRPDGNVLVDSPRYSAPLVRRLEALGGVRWMFLTHRDDIADHAKFHAHFGCDRILHQADGGARLGVEVVLEGEDPVRLAPDLEILPTPGHTRGSACLLYRDQALFTGDTLAWSARLGHVIAFREACWYSWDVLQQSVARLATRTYSWLLPGHGAPVHLPAAEMVRSVLRCGQWMAAPRSAPSWP